MLVREIESGVMKLRRITIDGWMDGWMSVRLVIKC
jgi:hypothetical protein